MKKEKNLQAPNPDAGQKPKRAGKGLRIAAKAMDVTVDMTAGVVGSVFKVIGTIFLILMLTGLMFACVFAYYVKSSLTPNLDLSL